MAHCSQHEHYVNGPQGAQGSIVIALIAGIFAMPRPSPRSPWPAPRIGDFGRQPAARRKGRLGEPSVERLVARGVQKFRELARVIDAQYDGINSGKRCDRADQQGRQRDPG